MAWEELAPSEPGAQAYSTDALGACCGVPAAHVEVHAEVHGEHGRELPCCLELESCQGWQTEHMQTACNMEPGCESDADSMSECAAEESEDEECTSPDGVAILMVHADACFKFQQCGVPSCTVECMDDDVHGSQRSPGAHAAAGGDDMHPVAQPQDAVLRPCCSTMPSLERPLDDLLPSPSPSPAPPLCAAAAPPPSPLPNSPAASPTRKSSQIILNRLRETLDPPELRGKARRAAVRRVLNSLQVSLRRGSLSGPASQPPGPAVLPSSHMRTRLWRESWAVERDLQDTDSEAEEGDADAAAGSGSRARASCGMRRGGVAMRVRWQHALAQQLLGAQATAVMAAGLMGSKRRVWRLGFATAALALGLLQRCLQHCSPA